MGVFTAGSARIFNILAFNLPNDERVRQEKGAKKVILRNSLYKDYNAITKVVSKKVIDNDQLLYLDENAFFNWVIFHELSHSLGPAFVGNNETNGQISKALKSSYNALEEGKADVMERTISSS